MAVTLEQLVQQLTQSGLLTAAEIAHFQDALSPERCSKDAESLTRELVQTDKLTKYQMARNVVGLCIAVLGMVLFFPSMLRADAQESFTQLNKRCWEQKRAGNLREAERLALELKSLAEGALAHDPERGAHAMNTLGAVYWAEGRYAEALPLYERSLAIFEKVLGPEHPAVATSLNNLACLCLDRGRYAEAEQFHRRALAIREKVLGPEHPDLADSLGNLAIVCRSQGRHAEAERLHQRSLAIRQKAFGPEHPDVADSLNNLAVLYDAQGRYADAESFYERALAIQERVRGPEHLETAGTLNNLGQLYSTQARYAEAEQFHRRSLAIREKVLGPEHPEVAESLNNLAVLYRQEGRYAEAEPLLTCSLKIREKVLGPENPDVAASLMNLANLHKEQSHYADAELLYECALAIQERVLGPEHPDTATSLYCLAVLYRREQRYAEAEPLFRRSLVIQEKALGAEHPDLAISLHGLANLYADQRRFTEAEPLFRRSLRIRENAFGDEHPQVAYALTSLAASRSDQGRYEDAEPLIDRAINIGDRAGMAADYRQTAYWVRADVRWARKRTAAAVADLKQAMSLAEQVRASAFGDERERAETFGTYINLFEKMVAWQKQLNGLSETLDAMERSRARGLLDQIETCGLDLLAGVPEQDAQLLRRREAEAQGRLAALQRELGFIAGRKDLSSERKKQESERIAAETRQAQGEVADAYVAVRNASPAYRLAVGKDLKPVPLERLRAWVAGQDALLLEYLAGSEGGYLLTVPAKGEARLHELAIDAQQAKALGVDAGPLTTQRLSTTQNSQRASGVLDRLRGAHSEEAEKKLVRALAALWELLIPAAQREAILAGKYKRIIVIPDGPLVQFPFETLVVDPGPNGEAPLYLLDAGPPMLYAPSATILMNLAERTERPEKPVVEPVLTVGDCRYHEPSQSASQGLLAQLTPRSRYGALGGQLEPLPYSAWEIQWVADVFGKQGSKVAWLRGDLATEAAVRANAPGRRVLHFACHGLVDQAYGNLFGALALTPGRDPAKFADDGFLTLAEIYGLNLKGCELTILSACETNVGPRNRGEGVWALSRGFLAAGSRRVVASNWLVDDEAAASLISYWCSMLANAEKERRLPDYARSLHEAKRWVRKQEKWQSPYYWGGFVLMGPSLGELAENRGGELGSERR